MGVFYKQQLSDPDDGKCVKCANCNTQLALCRDLLSRNFRGRTGGAMLFDRVVNITTGPLEVLFILTNVEIILLYELIFCATILFIKNRIRS